MSNSHCGWRVYAQSADIAGGARVRLYLADEDTLGGVLHFSNRMPESEFYTNATDEDTQELLRTHLNDDTGGARPLARLSSARLVSLPIALTVEGADVLAPPRRTGGNDSSSVAQLGAPLSLHYTPQRVDSVRDATYLRYTSELAADAAHPVSLEAFAVPASSTSNSASEPTPLDVFELHAHVRADALPHGSPERAMFDALRAQHIISSSLEADVALLQSQQVRIEAAAAVGRAAAAAGRAVGRAGARAGRAVGKSASQAARRGTQALRRGAARTGTAVRARATRAGAALRTRGTALRGAARGRIMAGARSVRGQQQRLVRGAGRQLKGFRAGAAQRAQSFKAGAAQRAQSFNAGASQRLQSYRASASQRLREWRDKRSQQKSATPAKPAAAATTTTKPPAGATKPAQQSRIQRLRERLQSSKQQQQQQQKGGSGDSGSSGGGGGGAAAAPPSDPGAGDTSAQTLPPPPAVTSAATRTAATLPATSALPDADEPLPLNTRQQDILQAAMQARAITPQQLDALQSQGVSTATASSLPPELLLSVVNSSRALRTNYQRASQRDLLRTANADGSPNSQLVDSAGRPISVQQWRTTQIPPASMTAEQRIAYVQRGEVPLGLNLPAYPPPDSQADASASALPTTVPADAATVVSGVPIPPGHVLVPQALLDRLMAADEENDAEQWAVINEFGRMLADAKSTPPPSAPAKIAGQLMAVDDVQAALAEANDNDDCPVLLTADDIAFLDCAAEIEACEHTDAAQPLSVDESIGDSVVCDEDTDELESLVAYMLDDSSAANTPLSAAYYYSRAANELDRLGERALDSSHVMRALGESYEALASRQRFVRSQLYHALVTSSGDFVGALPSHESLADSHAELQRYSGAWAARIAYALNQPDERACDIGAALCACDAVHYPDAVRRADALLARSGLTARVAAQ
jgi:hypothetical protein